MSESKQEAFVKKNPNPEVFRGKSLPSAKGKKTGKISKYNKPKNVAYRKLREEAKYNKKPKPVRPDIKNQQCMKCLKTLPIHNFKFRNRTAMYSGKCIPCTADKIPDNVESLSYKERKQKDPDFRATCSLRSRLNRMCVREHKGKSKDKTSKLFGAGNGVILKWIDFNLELDSSKGFTQENKGKFWLLYNVIPTEHFNLIDKKTQRIAFHWTNLKPMRTKGHKEVVSTQVCLEHELRLKIFGIENNIKFGNSAGKGVFTAWGALTTAVNKKLLMQQ
jgi:hypothetical protein